MWITLTKPWKSKLVPTAGIEPATCWLQVSCTTNCAKSAFGCRRKSRTFVPRLSVAYSNRWARRQFGEVRRIRTCDITHTAFALPTEIGPQRNKIMVGIVGFEPTTFRLEGERSIQLSYIPKYWLGRLDSNQSMQESKSCALPAWLHPNIYGGQSRIWTCNVSYVTDLQSACFNQFAYLPRMALSVRFELTVHLEWTTG